MKRTAVVTAALLTALLLAGCTSALRSEDATGRPAATAASPAASSVAAAEPVATPAPSTTVQADDAGRCAPGPGKEVEDLPDVTIAAVHADAYVADATEVDGERIEGFSVAAVDLPERVVDGGCVVRYDAPAGCLGAVEITGVEIPAVELPGYEIPGVRAVQAKAVAGNTVQGSRVGGDRAEQVCQERPGTGGFVAQVFRRALFRPQAFRGEAFRSQGFRPPVRVGDTQLAAVSVPAIVAPAVVVPAATVPAETISARTVPKAGGTRVFQGDGSTAYVAPSDVLFDFGKDTLRPQATTALRVIAADLRRGSGTGPVLVEGHTDSVGSDAANQALSERRARAVANWLTAEGGVPASRLKVRGYGEQVPVAPNAVGGRDDPAGRAKNRRVVIQVPAA